MKENNSYLFFSRHQKRKTRLDSSLNFVDILDGTSDREIAFFGGGSDRANLSITNAQERHYGGTDNTNLPSMRDDSSKKQTHARLVAD